MTDLFAFGIITSDPGPSDIFDLPDEYYADDETHDQNGFAIENCGRWYNGKLDDVCSSAVCVDDCPLRSAFYSEY